MENQVTLISKNLKKKKENLKRAEINRIESKHQQKIPDKPKVGSQKT